ncbi:MAG TPA: dephospho-CoA kinase [Gordonia sp. (in: high G+C Gram-positive bacteria)]|uniref:dephospho-CoA kinase n=1 Tax=unclassified Gordonia (in: high G+C Gram-positive bacteria) TaxID=2657482 RepID=UPI000FA655EB|nr:MULTISPECIES: dephospho-CoA kinase [unclassified Gordonia (in: high G+C Gram-positive bacteria)]RUP35742.1 MAG: dephospho-CoA kinase [Gordonia sp. (in: high G+C Gram-positive bacteria)]HNP58008.1 dephospho-CoA kinase [Gordonia sp. (in: high G+C Gram-positive bacteria)]HRC51747.1 dephospho-CoA kinase [Gordonia sp. (in: high G+C Gram-positive bacteria)]
MIRVGLTGGMGAGKSTVARTFVERGAYLIDADKIARDVVAVGTPGLAALEEAFGSDVIGADGELDRAALAAKAFVDDESRGKLNAITHPRIGARTAELLDAAPADAIVVQDIPLLVENHTAPFFHHVIVVDADVELRVHRLVNSRGLDEADARARIAAQATNEQRHAVADAWLANHGSEAELAEQAIDLWAQRLVPYEANVRAGLPATARPELVERDPNPESLPTRLTNRLWAVAGDKATAVTVTGSEPVTSLQITARDAEAAAALPELLRAGGFPADESGTFASADPGRPAIVRVVVG